MGSASCTEGSELEAFSLWDFCACLVWRPHVYQTTKLQLHPERSRTVRVLGLNNARHAPSCVHTVDHRLSWERHAYPAALAGAFQVSPPCKVQSPRHVQQHHCCATSLRCPKWYASLSRMLPTGPRHVLELSKRRSSISRSHFHDAIDRNLVLPSASLTAYAC